MLDDEIKHSRAILESTNVDIQTINEYKQLKAELNRYHLTSEDPGKLLTVLDNLKDCRYDPKKVVAEFSNIKSLKRIEKALQNNCKILEERVAEQITRLRIGIGELLAFHTAVCECAEMHNLSMESAAYHVIEDIQAYNRLGAMKKELSNTGLRVYAMNQFSACQNRAIISLIKLQSQGVTEDQILPYHEYLERNNSLFDVKDRTI
jgi:hypothetical protein